MCDECEERGLEICLLLDCPHDRCHPASGPEGEPHGKPIGKPLGNQGGRA